MAKRSFDRLLRPQHVAVIGGGAWGRSVLKSLKGFGFEGSIQAVHPRLETLEGIRCVAEIAALDPVPDAVFLGINRDATIDAVKQLAEILAGGVVCFASGFSETGDGTTREDQLVAAAGDMPVLGPNCYGFLNALDGTALWPDVHGLTPVDTGVAILTQSSNIVLNLTMQQRGLPIGFCASVGNQAQTGLADLGLALLQDPRITALGLHIEGVGDPGQLHTLALAADRLGKPIVALKAGRSDAARAATVSHTASLAGSAAGASALLRHLGFAEVRTLEGLIEALKIAHVAGCVGQAGIASLSCSGGEAGLIADQAQAAGVRFAPLLPQQVTTLSTALGSKVTVANPLDYHTYIWTQTDIMADVFAAMMQGPAAMTLIVVDVPRADRCDPSAWDCVFDAARMARARVDRPLACVATLAESLPERLCEALMADGILPLSGLTAALEAIAALQSARAPQQAPPWRPNTGPTRMIAEAEAKQALSAFGLEIPCGGVAHASTDLPDLIPNQSYVVKGQGVAHKSETGAVILNLKGSDQIAAAITQTGTPALVEEHISDGVAELLIGVVADPAHGYVLTLGAGGVLTELWDDTQSLLLPAHPDDVRDALARLRIAPLLNGYRGKPAADLGAIERAIFAIVDYVQAQNGAVQEIEINPLIVTPNRAVAADALIQTLSQEVP